MDRLYSEWRKHSLLDPTSCLVFEDFLRRELTQEARKDIEELTRDQALSEEWKKQRKFRITASVGHKILHMTRRTASNKDNYIVKIIAGQSTFWGNEATAYGCENEHVARNLYISLSGHRQTKVNAAGLFISEDYPFLGATPDGIITCACCDESGVLEIKCPFSKRHLPPGELEILDRHYAQIQMQMAVTQKTYCDFVVYTGIKPYIHVKRVQFNKLYWENILLPKLINFFHMYIEPSLNVYA